jgi:cell wall-associated NlpC family hydrolase
VGTNYVWGGKDSKKDGGLDCSGVAQNSIETASGVRPKVRSADMQFKDPKLTVPGDGSAGTLNFYDYDGDGNMDHETICRGDGTEVNPVGNEMNTRDNPGTIIITTQGENPAPVNRQVNWHYIYDN